MLSYVEHEKNITSEPALLLFSCNKVTFSYSVANMIVMHFYVSEIIKLAFSRIS